VKSNVAALIDRAIETVANARAPKEPPSPMGPDAPPDRAPSLERPSCPLCGATRGKIVLLARDTWTKDGDARHAIVRCSVCSVRYTSPRYKKDLRRLAYGPSYPFHLRAKDALETGRPIDRARAREPFFDRARRVCELEPTPGRVLDLGCGDGFFLDVMRDHGWETVGVDFEPSVVSFAKERLALDARVLEIESEPLPSGLFDAVTIWGGLQLTYRPQRLLEKIRGALAPRGLLAIGVSNIKSAGAIVFKQHWYGLGVPRHLVHFTPETLKRLLGWSGYRVERIAFETPRWITWSSIDDIAIESDRTRKLAKAAAAAIGVVTGRTAYGDTMQVYARPES
jgi:SAM-dependent methyltransferase